jgi:hypothetical protein
MRLDIKDSTARKRNRFNPGSKLESDFYSAVNMGKSTGFFLSINANVFQGVAGHGDLWRTP